MSESRSQVERDRRQTRRSMQSSTYMDFGREQVESQPSTALALKQSGTSKTDEVNSADQDYIDSLCRSIQQMKDGDVQPVREGLAELRRELEEDDEINPMDT